jgi:hypothetical protein
MSDGKCPKCEQIITREAGKMMFGPNGQVSPRPLIQVDTEPG